MKYSKFKKIAGEFGWEIDDSYDDSIYADKPAIRISIDKTKTGVFIIIADDEYCNFFEEKEFIKACYELAETPIEDREDEKYYIVELPFSNYENKKLSLRMSFAAPYWCTIFASRFTEKEIKEIDPRLWEFAVEVEGVQY